MRRVIIATALAVASTGQGFAMDSLSTYEWKNRVVIVFGASQDETASRQIEALGSQEAALADRDMVVLQVEGDTVRTIYGPPSSPNAAALKSEAGVEGDRFSVVLVGKDGGVKLRSDKIVSDVEMFDLIDRMPMRQSEQR